MTATTRAAIASDLDAQLFDRVLTATGMDLLRAGLVALREYTPPEGPAFPAAYGAAMVAQLAGRLEAELAGASSVVLMTRRERKP